MSGTYLSRKRSRTAEAIGRAKDHIEENYSERINLEDLAVIAELSVFRFATVFRREVGLPPHRYLCQVRAQHAQRLLREGVSPAIAASEAGFFDQSHLSRHFKNIFGITPGQYQSAVRKSSATDFATTVDARMVMKGSAVAAQPSS
jgi:AraC-like DNA-binding protein